MTHTERTRFIILFIVVLVLIGLGFVVNRLQREGSVGADILGEIHNQAVATFKSDDGLEFTTLSDVSKLQVSGGETRLSITYKLGNRPNQNAKFDIQFFNAESGELITTLRDLNGQQGVVKVTAKNIPNGIYDISVKPVGFLSQSRRDVTYSNGVPTTVNFEKDFGWGDIDVSHNGKGDNIINNADWARLLSAWGEADQDLLATTDYNGDGRVNNVDASVMLANWGPPGEQFVVEAATDQAEVPDDFN